MIFLIYTIFVILLCKGMTTVVKDSCPSDIEERIVVDMCTSRSATENVQQSGSYQVDSVVLRVLMQQDNCICRVTIENQIIPLSIALGSYADLTSSTPEKSDCGLAVDINYIPDMSTRNVTLPFKCVENVKRRNIQLFQNSTLQFKSRIINGTFTKGYCMQIQRDIKSNSTQVLRIDCDGPMTTEQTTGQTIQSDPTSDTSGRTTEENTIIGTKTDTSNDVVSPSIITATDLTTSNTINTVNHDNDKSKGLEQTTYIAIGTGSGVALLLLVVLVVICLRRKSTQKAGTNGNVNKSYQQEESDDKLPCNVLYVPAGEFDIIGGNYSTADVDTARSSNERVSMEGDYSTVDEDIPNITNNRKSIDGDYSTVELDEHLDANFSYPANSELGQTKGKQKPAIKPKPKAPCVNSEENRSSDQSIKHITPPNGSDSFYAVVDKSSKRVPTANIGKEEATCQPDQTYAVVDKTRKRNSNPDETNKKNFEINYCNKV